MGIRWISKLGLGLVALFGSFALAETPARPALPFGPGERFEFNLTALGASAGRLRLGVIDQGTYQGRKLMSLAAKLEPGGIVSLFWKGESRRTTFFDTTALTPLRVIDVEESAEKTWKTQFDFNGVDSVIVTRFGANKSDGSDVVSKRLVPGNALDALSGLYQLRARDLAVGDSFQLALMDNGRLYEMAVTVERKEKVKSVLGEVEALVISMEGRRAVSKPAKPRSRAQIASDVTVSGPAVASARPVAVPTPASAPASQPASAPVRPAEILTTVWLSTDKSHLPLKFSIQYGKTGVTAELSSYTPVP